MIDHNNLINSTELKGWRYAGMNGIQTHGLCDTDHLPIIYKNFNGFGISF